MRKTPTILVVDDDSSTVWAMTMLLRQDGHQVVSFTSGYDAVSALRVGPPFDAVVTDFEMPSVNGVAVARAAREYSPSACILVTNRGRADLGLLHGAGVCVVLEKPIQYDAMERLISVCRATRGSGGPQCARRLPALK